MRDRSASAERRPEQSTVLWHSPCTAWLAVLVALTFVHCAPGSSPPRSSDARLTGARRECASLALRRCDASLDRMACRMLLRRECMRAELAR